MKSSRSAVGSGRRLTGALLLMAASALAGTAVAAETVKIYRSVMPDGSVVLGDKPSPGARSVATDTIVLTAPRGAAEAERDYWRRQAEEFNLRQQRRDAADGPRLRMGAAAGDDVALYDDEYRPLASLYDHRAGAPLVPLRHVPKVYTSSPGAVNGRSSGFIGSGFSTASSAGRGSSGHGSGGHGPGGHGPGGSGGPGSGSLGSGSPGSGR